MVYFILFSSIMRKSSSSSIILLVGYVSNYLPLRIPIPYRISVIKRYLKNYICIYIHDILLI